MQEEKNTVLDIIDAIDRLTDAVDALDKDGGGLAINLAPIANILTRISDLMEMPDMTLRDKCALADHRTSLFRLLRRFRARLIDVIGRASTAVPDPGPDVRPTVSQAMASNQTADALGALLRISEWVAKVEAKYLPDEI